MIHFAPRGHLSFQHLLLASAIITGIGVDAKLTKKEQAANPQKCMLKAASSTTNVLNTSFNINKK